jgi:hypothetical protein
LWFGSLSVHNRRDGGHREAEHHERPTEYACSHRWISTQTSDSSRRTSP